MIRTASALPRSLFLSGVVLCWVGCGVERLEATEGAPTVEAPSALEPEPPPEMSRPEDSQPPTPTPPPDPCSEDGPAGWSNATYSASGRRYVGRVVRPGGAPLADVEVRLVGSSRTRGQTEHAYVADETRTDGRGYFSSTTPPVPVDHIFYLSLSRGELRRGVAGRSLGEGTTDFGTIHLRPSRTARVTVRCSLERSLGNVHVVGERRRPGSNASTWLSRFVHREQCPSLVPNFQPGSHPVASPHEQGFDAVLPMGRNRLIFQNCGVVVREVEVPAGDGPLDPIVVEMPDPESGTLTLRVEDPERDTSYSTLLWNEITETRVRVDEARPESSLRHLAPGRYRVGDPERPRCQRVLELRPNGTATRTFGGGSCVWERAHVTRGAGWAPTIGVR